MNATEELDGRTEDINLGILPIIEESYGIRFEGDELKNVRTFGILCDIILSKITNQNMNDCTSQQAFYKLREAIVVSSNMDKEAVKIDTPLDRLFPKRGRKKQIKALEKHLGFKLKILSPPAYIVMTLTLLLVLAFLGGIISYFLNFYFLAKCTLIGFISSIISLRIAQSLGREFTISTVGELAKKITIEHYLASRRNPLTVNKSEIVKNIEKLFITNLYLDVKEIKPDTIIA